MAKPRPTRVIDPRLARAIEVFGQGFGFTRSFTHPYIGTKIGPLWALRDAPRLKVKDYRREEWIVSGTDPIKADQLIRKHTRGRYCISAFCDLNLPEQSLRDAYKAIGYRFGGAEPLMIHDLKQIPHVKSPATIQRVLTPDLADAVAQAAGSRQILPEYLAADATLRQYAAKINDKVVGWVQNIGCEHGSWCSNMAVPPKYRRQGIASALLAQLLRDDRKYGIKVSVLTSSKAGANLYSTLGYKEIGTLLLFTPPK